MIRLTAEINGLICCRECNLLAVICPNCGKSWRSTPVRPGRLTDLICPCSPGVQTQLLVLAVGYRPNPTGESAPQSWLSPDVSRLARCWAQPAAQRPAVRMARPAAPPAPPPPPWRPRPAGPIWPTPPSRTPQPRRPEHLQPCPAGTRRLRFYEWIAAGLVPAGVAAAAVAAAYRRRFGVSPCRDPRRRSYRCYSLRELGQSLTELGLGLVQRPPAGWESAAEPTKPDPYNPEP